MNKQQPQRGLPSIHKAREERGRGKFSRPATQTYLYVALAIAASLVVYHVVAARQVAADRQALLDRQRATEASLGAKWTPLRERIEKATAAAATPDFAGDRVDPEVRTWDFRAMPGIYLRLRVAEAKDGGALRQAADQSARDAFVGQLLKTQPAADGGAFPDQPWNLRQAYAATRVLTPEWVRAVKESEDDLRLRVFQQQYERANATEIPTAVDIVSRARFFLLVLDEDADEARAFSDAGAITMEGLQLVPHASRIHVWDLRRDLEMIRLRRTGQASFVMAGEGAGASPETREAMQRQVNNADLAQQVRRAIDEATTAAK